jgi:hypothetical protein
MSDKRRIPRSLKNHGSNAYKVKYWLQARDTIWKWGTLASIHEFMESDYWKQQKNVGDWRIVKIEHTVMEAWDD